jgi:ribA/ribD-fused uncharacterized protein
VTEITSFSGEYRWLSNFWQVEVKFDGDTYPSVENAYQAAKASDITERWQFKNMTAAQAKKAGKTIKSFRVDWDFVKVPIMRDLIRHKFMNPELRAKLIATGNAELIEGNWWGDKFWGVCKNDGLNWLGKILMEVRSEIIIAGNI